MIVLLHNVHYALLHRRGGTGMRPCWLKVVGAAGVAFLALAAGAKNLETYLYLPGAAWIVGGTLIVVFWAYRAYCMDMSGDEET